MSRVNGRYTDAYRPNEVMANIDDILIYTKTLITCNDDLTGQIFVGLEEMNDRRGDCYESTVQS